ncbi:cysteine hydrolase family protein [Alkalihalobacterium elongatum]|uniref:cysteine hydrolase family protein n=1 Tax=Alkalihalobacterium elongatum TaxID=2675466 RepID=UPI001C1FB9BA|nr:isochorismatase family cysteine hydrolase [Alkalihalobacterium elongatum]
MPIINKDLHDFVPDNKSVALLIIDMINDFEFDDGEKLYEFALPAAKQIALLKASAKKQNVPVIYVNDNYGKWQSDFRHLIDHCLHDGVRGQAITELLLPDDDDYFVLKPKYSGFYSTPLDLLLQYLKVNTLIITGVAGNMCVQFTANDAYMRDFLLYIPEDCVASNDKIVNEEAIHLMKTVLKASTAHSTHLKIEEIITKANQCEHKPL